MSEATKPEKDTASPTGKEVATRPSREVRAVHDVVPLFDTSRFEHMQRVATLMASMTLIPDGLKTAEPQKTAANCFLIVNQAVKWEMDPFAVAQMVSVVHGRLCYEGKLIHAVIEKELKIRLNYEYTGEKGTEGRGIVVSGRFADEDNDRTIEGTVADWKVVQRRKDGGGETSAWVPKTYDRMLAYRGAREWARRHAPGVLLGVYDRDEMLEAEPWGEDEPPEAPRDVPIPVGNVTSEAVGNAHSMGFTTEEGYPELPENLRRKPNVEDAEVVEGKDEQEIAAERERLSTAIKASEDKAIAEALDRHAKQEAEADIASARAREAEADEPPAPPSEAEPAKEEPAQAAISADSILDQADVDLRVAKTPAEVQAVKAKYQTAVDKLLKPDAEEFGIMVAAALKRVAGGKP